ncbi:sigma-54-dependent Fis family transcriptional regulator [Chromohalobacter nigrandesensis]|uniref:sigma-54-dependent Fis family transcriptional regulator n=1 Tax=Chromohalobacter nigrandesensis TaxID=119863 RepID=UPI001FF5F0D9|nr:sigma-54-dependent Fis family transcriptional regulator [Chromohalobacter nigrandesensis]MCK0744262.1 sigma 54-interacting transcriptional regulator [Chromohalobacter nigrandesensis]
MPRKLRLSEIAAQAQRADSIEDALHAGDPPTLHDLTESLRFTPNDGRIWFDTRRMLLFGANSFSALRRELIEALGPTGARDLLMRVGFSAGASDAAFVRKHWPGSDDAGVLTAGERLHAVMGMVKVETIRRDHDIPNGTFDAEFLWHDSIEAAEHIKAYGLSPEPICWMQLGYASGYASAFYGKRVIYRELECAGCGSSHCRIVGETTDERMEDIEDLSWLQLDRHTLPKNETPVRTARRKTEASSTSGDTSLGVDFQRIVGVSAAVSIALQKIERVAPTPATVLLNGESGVGKDLFANALHRNSLLAEGPFVALNCAAIPETLIEAELFGVEKGAFTGAERSRPGRFERADGGTLFLDEIPSLSLEAQGKLLRTLQDGEIERVGGGQSIRVDVRIVAASNKDLFQEVQAGRFREDLYYRLNVFPIRLPPLRERRDDIPLLVEHFSRQYAERYRKSITGLTRKASDALLEYDYPGNIRELQNLMERGVINAVDGGPIDILHLFEDTGFSSNPGPKLRINDAGDLETAAGPTDSAEVSRPDTTINPATEREAEMLKRILSDTEGNVSLAARELGITRAKMAYRLQKLELDPSRYRYPNK